MNWLSLLFLSQTLFANHTIRPVFKDDLIYENSADVTFSTTLTTPFFYQKAKYQNFMDILNKTNDPAKKIAINIFTAESDPLPAEHFENGKSVVIRKGTQWRVAHNTDDTIVLETLRQSPKHTLMCRVSILKRGLFSITEVGDINECASALKIKPRKFVESKNVYTIE